MAGKRILSVGITAAFIALAYFGWKLTARGGYETAAYTVLESDGPFEIRQYDDLMLATTRMRFESQGDDGSFSRLFRYISGANDHEQKVAMTTPVFMDSQANESQGQMGFVIPRAVTDERIPQPANDNVQIRSRPGGRFAVIRFNGRMNPESVAKAKSELCSWAIEKGLIRDGDAELAGYDPPWTPGPLRRNEVLIRLK